MPVDAGRRIGWRKHGRPTPPVVPHGTLLAHKEPLPYLRGSEPLETAGNGS